MKIDPVEDLVKSSALIKHLLLCLFIAQPLSASADTNEAFSNQHDFSSHSVRYSVFNSTFVPADVAKAYGIKRSAYESLINVSVSPLGEYGAYPSKISGTVTNLLQQQQILEFIEIAEKDATYYIAPLRVNGREDVHIELKIQPEGSDEELNLKFSQKLYSDK